MGGVEGTPDGTTLPTYFDPAYNTTIELLRFDSRHPSAKYDYLIEWLRSQLTRVPVIVRSPARLNYAG